MNVTGGATDVTTYFQLRNVADGTDATGKTITAFDLSYTRSGATTAAKVDATALGAANSAHGDNQMIEVDATDCPGLYRVDWADAAFAAGVPTVELTVKHADIQTATKEINIDSPVDVTKISGDSTAADNAELAFDGTGFGFTGCTMPTVTALTGHTAQTGDSFARIGAAGASLTDLGGMSTTMKGQINTEADTALTDYDPPTKAEMDTAHALLATPAQVNTQMLDVLATDTHAEPGQAEPPDTPTLTECINYVFRHIVKDKITNDGTDMIVYMDDGTTERYKYTVADAAGTASRAKAVTGV